MRVAAWIDAEKSERIITDDGNLVKLDLDGYPQLLDKKHLDESLTEFVRRVERFYKGVQGLRRTV